MTWLSSLNSKKYKRRMSQTLRRMNKSIERDPLWKGRFIVRLVGSPLKYVYQDRSGMEYFVTMRFIDKQTGIHRDFLAEVNSACMWNGSKIFWAMNNFIIKDCKVWEECPRPSYETSIDYTNK